MSRPEVDSMLPELPPDEAELARQLFALRHRPSQALQRRIRTIPQQPAYRTWPVPKLAGVVGALVLIALLFMSPPAQATLGEVRRVVGQIHLVVRSAWPEPTATIVLPEAKPISLTEAQALLPFELSLPGEIPPGLDVTKQEVFISQVAGPVIKLRWPDQVGGFVQLSARAAGSENEAVQTLVGPASSESLLVNGQPAVIVRGGWDETSGAWSYEDQVITLIWTVDGVQYKLLSLSRSVSLTELIAMAESIQPAGKNLHNLK